MTKHWKKGITALLMGTALLASTVVWAGQNVTGSVVVILPDRAYGLLGDARTSSSPDENIGCEVSIRGLDGDEVGVMCAFKDRNSQEASCYSERPAFIKVAQMLSPYTWLYVEYNVINGECTKLHTRVGSPYLGDLEIP